MGGKSQTIDEIMQVPLSIYAVGHRPCTAATGTQFRLMHCVCYRFLEPYAYLGCFKLEKSGKCELTDKFYAAVPGGVHKPSEISFYKNSQLSENEFEVLSLFHAGSCIYIDNSDLLSVMNRVIQDAESYLKKILTYDGRHWILNEIVPGIEEEMNGEKIVKIILNCSNVRIAQMLLECSGLSKKELGIKPVKACPCCKEDIDNAAEACAICHKSVCENCITTCDSCGKDICVSCCEIEGAFALHSGVTLCSECQEKLLCCEICGEHSDNKDYIVECKKCNQMVCEACMTNHVKNCEEVKKDTK